MRYVCAYILIAFALLLPPLAGAQTPAKKLPKSPTEALARALEPLRKAYKSGTFEDQARAYEEQKRRAAGYASLFKAERLKGKELLSLAELFWYADQPANTEKALLAYLKDPSAPEAARARTLLVRSYLSRKKIEEALPVAEILLDEPTYSGDTLTAVQDLIDAQRGISPLRGCLPSRKDAPEVVRFCRGQTGCPVRGRFETSVRP